MRCCAGSVWDRSNPGKHALDYADSTAPTLQNELHHTHQESVFSLKDLPHGLGADETMSKKLTLTANATGSNPSCFGVDPTGETF